MPIKKEAYLCISAMLRAREPKLLNNEKAERMLDAASFEDAAKLLTDCGYEDMSQMNASEIEKALAEHRSVIFDELRRLGPADGVVDFFCVKYDYHNAKVILKSEAMSLNPEHLLSDAGRISGDELLALYGDEKYSYMPGKLGAALEKAKSLLARTSNPQTADFELDRCYFAELAETAAKSDNTYLKDYTKMLIDTANLKGAVRSMKMGKNSLFLSEVLIPGGSIDVTRILAAGDKDALQALYSHSKLERAAELGAEVISGSGMTDFEKECDNAVNSFLRSAKLVSYGCETVVAYLAALENEITAVRMILTGRLAGVDSSRLKERLRDMYA